MSRIRKLKKTGLSAAVLLAVTAAAFGTVAYADAEPNSFEEVVASYGDNSAPFISTLEGDTPIQLVYCKNKIAATYTQTNVRTLPDAASDKVGTLEADVPVKVWGVTDNGWYQTYSVTPEGVPFFGYIRNDLLIFS